MNIGENPGKIDLNHCHFGLEFMIFWWALEQKRWQNIDKSMRNFIKWDKCNESVIGKSFRIRVRVDITPTKKENYSKTWRKDDKKDFVQI